MSASLLIRIFYMKKRPIHIRLANRLRELRKIHDFSQEKLAEKADLHPTFIGKIERAEINPSLVTLEKIANAFNLPISGLLIFSDDEKIYSKNLEKLKDSLNKAAEELKVAKDLVHGSMSKKKKD
jgi:transcriptional regulator with XRE-family HTH domain